MSRLRMGGLTIFLGVLLLSGVIMGLIFGAVARGLICGFCIAGSVLIGVLLASHLYIPDGQIVANYSDPKKDTYRLELGIPFGELDNRRIVIFRIEKED